MSKTTTPKTDLGTNDETTKKVQELVLVDEANGTSEVIEAAEPTAADFNRPGFQGAKYKRQLAKTDGPNAKVNSQNECLNALAFHVGFPEAHEALGIFNDVTKDIDLRMGGGFGTYAGAAQFAREVANSGFGKGRREILHTVAAMLDIETTHER